MQIKFIRSLMLMGLAILLCSWGDKGHQKINESASNFFSGRLNHFKGWTEKLSEHSSDADHRKKSDLTEGVKHYIDIDNYNDFSDNKQIAELKVAAFTQYGRDFVMINGTLPWVTDSTYQSLVNQFRAKEWDKAVLTAADLGHYVGDGYMPLHLTGNYDGELTGQTGIHSRYESVMLNQFIGEISVKRTTPEKISNIRRYIFDYIYNNYRYKDSLLNADRVAFEKANLQYNDLYYQTLWNQTKGFTEKLISGASNSLAALIRTAWIEAGRPRLPREINFGDGQKGAMPQSHKDTRIHKVLNN